ncbi:MAG: lysylphosphatidylglycerol synthase domain-containing protein [Kiritimatiellia bacterium]|jgi:hypothetical protein
MKRIVLKLLVSLGVSIGVFALLLAMASRGGEGVTAGCILAAMRNAVAGLVAAYALCQLVQTMLRALRNRVLLQAGMPKDKQESVPGLWHITLVTFVRGACADMLPARIGELSYVAMLNRGYDIPISDAMTSLSIGLLFDFAALLIVLISAITTISQGFSLLGSAIILLLVCLVGWSGLFHILPWFAKLLGRRSPASWLRFKPYAWVVTLLEDMAASVRFVAHSGTVLPVLGISALIRFVKYLGLYWLFMAVARGTWPHMASANVPSVLVALISAEGAASLPLPSFMSFGSYEAGGSLALTALGFALADAVTAMTAMHVISQAIDYSLGGLAFLAFLWLPRTDDEAAWQSRGKALAALGVSAAVLAALAMLALRMPAAETSEAARAIGEPVERSAPDLPLHFDGRIVWSSNRAGSHDLYLMELPSGKERRITASAFTDTYPRFSPDGRRVAFSRSHQPYVSQRDPLKWDTWVVDLETGRETRVATNAFTATWHPDGESLVYVRNGDRIVRQKAEPGAPEQVLLAAGTRDIPAGTEFQTPEVGRGGEAVAVTLRRRVRGTWVFWNDGRSRRIGDGCQLMWTGRPAGHLDELLWVDAPGSLGHAFYSASADGGTRQIIYDPPAEWSHEYFPRTCFTDGKRNLWMVYGASTGGHEHDQADYEIFLWRLGGYAKPFRLTWHTGNDCWPDVHAR